MCQRLEQLKTPGIEDQDLVGWVDWEYVDSCVHRGTDQIPTIKAPAKSPLPPPRLEPETSGPDASA
eukprot:1157785-Pelagomonas_calceolata.AAC.1